MKIFLNISVFCANLWGCRIKNLSNFSFDTWEHYNVPGLFESLSEALYRKLHLLRRHYRRGLHLPRIARLCLRSCISVLLRRWWPWRHIEEKVLSKLHLLLCVVRRAATLNHWLIHLVLGTRGARKERLNPLSIGFAALTSALLPG